jgi:Zn-dependent protease with chaperone function
VNTRSTTRRIACESHRAVYEVLAVLPSESTIHFYVYCSLIFLTLVFVIGTPAVALLFAEHRPIAGLFFLIANLGIFCIAFVFNHRRIVALPRSGRLRLFARTVLRKLQDVRQLKALASRFTIPTGPSFRVFPGRSGAASFLDFYERCWRESTGSDSPLPGLYWTYQERKVAARVVGYSQRPLVLVNAGLVSLIPQKTEVARVYLLHEFGHIVGRDLEVFAYTITSSRACIAVFFSTTLISAFVLSPFIDGSILSGLVLLVSTMWILMLAALWILLVRYAGVIISLRELYADVQAVIWLRGFDVYKTILLEQSRPGFNKRLSRFRSLISLRLIHLSPAERLFYLQQPGSLLYPRHVYYLLVALILIALQSNPFGEGYENNWMRWIFLLAWSPIGFAYLMNVARGIFGIGLLGRKMRVMRTIGQSLGVAIVLSLPMLRVPGLYGDVLFSIGRWETLRSSVAESAKTLAAQWGHFQYLAPLALALFWLVLSGWLARRRLKHLESDIRISSELGWRNRSTFLIATFAILTETALLAIRDYGNTTATAWDAFQAQLGKLPAAPPISGLFVLILGSFWVWREQSTRNGTSGLED